MRGRSTRAPTGGTHGSVALKQLVVAINSENLFQRLGVTGLSGGRSDLGWRTLMSRPRVDCIFSPESVDLEINFCVERTRLL